MGDPRQIEPSDFQGTSLEQMQGWVEGGKGAQPLFKSSEEWAKENEHLLELAEKVNGKLKEAGVVMQSKSGEAMQNAVAPVVQWTEVTAENTKAQSQLMQEQGDAYNKVQSSIPAKSEVQAVPDDNWFEESWDSMVNGQTDAEAANAHNEKLRQEAVTAFNGYDNASQSTVSASAVFTPPPASTSDVAVSGGQHPGVGGMTPAPGTGGSVSPAGSGSSGYSGGGSGGGYTGGGSGGGGGYTGGGGGGSSTTPSWSTPNPTGGGGGYQPYPGPGGNNQYGPGPGVLPPSTSGGGGGRGGGGGTGAGRGGTGAGAGAGGRSGAGAGAGRGALGPGGQSGVGAGGRAGAGMPGAGGVGGAGGRGGAAGMGGAAGRGQGQQGEEDQEHETPEYLKGDQGVFDDELPKVAPPVFGDWNQK